MSDDLIARRVLQEQQGCESESGILTINRCYFKHDFSAQIHTHTHTAYGAHVTATFHSPLFFFCRELKGRERILWPSVSSGFMHSVKKIKSRLTFGTYGVTLV